jgi:hypothetical protein
VALRTLAAEWQTHVLPMCKPSTQKSHRYILEKELLPRFGGKALAVRYRDPVDGCGYDSVVIVAHSLDSLISADLLRFFHE